VAGEYGNRKERRERGVGGRKSKNERESTGIQAIRAGEGAENSWTT
jgi:hypothetical protein